MTLNKQKNYIWEKIEMYYLEEPEYGDSGWFISFNTMMGYKNEPISLYELPLLLQELIVSNVTEV